MKLTFGSRFLQEQGSLCSFPTELSPGSSLPVLSLLPATLLSKCTRLVTYCLRCSNISYGCHAVDCIYPLWSVYLAPSTLRRSHLGWFWSVDTVGYPLILSCITLTSWNYPEELA